ncbi:TenA family transcriptional regulator [Streptacidiphilus sp. PB12-B1b]|uniref:TenA family protein n=1 Tax=Streptacidiphilus sp. PB12-B1b TaxID=2705012 RepID=UPI0015FDC9F5|nr:TenA family transcriptional regulator [Streptacidiphilus sp. PB12-B1b]QMU78154.1 TenA family transcriptional regulator [Streptacidiphilus sp. PB12-B1b]
MVIPIPAGPAGTALREELGGFVAEGARRICTHPYYTGLCDGTLPGRSLVHFTLQDSCHLLPSYGRAQARCSALARNGNQARVLSRMATSALEDAEVRLDGFAKTAARLGLPLPTGPAAPAPAPATLAYANFLTAASSTSLAAGVGAVLPSAWLYMLVTDDLLVRHDPFSRYAEEVEKAHPGEFYRGMLGEFLDLAEEVAAGSSAAERAELVRHAELAVRYEWAFVDAAWQLQSWPF